jgi:predicted nucleic acid binding AN1-type Zn finger protein
MQVGEVAKEQQGGAQCQGNHQHLTTIFDHTQNEICAKKRFPQNDACRIDDRDERSEHDHQG